MERLDKLVAAGSEWSRKDVRNLVKRGRITVDGIPAAAFDQKVEATSIVLVDDEPIVQKRRVVAVFNKPAGYVTSTEDPVSPTVMSLLPSWMAKMEVFPVGRLDKETEGLLLFTNDGNLAHHLISPKHEVKKVYRAKHSGTATGKDVEAFAKGIVLSDDTVCKPALLVPQGEGESLVTVTEGKYHQVRRMMASRGLDVLYLERISEGGLVLGDLKRGEMRELTAEEERLLLES